MKEEQWWATRLATDNSPRRQRSMPHQGKQCHGSHKLGYPVIVSSPVTILTKKDSTAEGYDLMHPQASPLSGGDKQQACPPLFSISTILNIFHYLLQRF